MSQEKISEEGSVTPEREYVNFGDICHKRLGITTRVGSFYLHGLGGYPNLGEGLKLKGNSQLIHSLEISAEDAETFIQRVEKFRKEQAKL